MWTAAYIISIVVVNWLFVVVQPLATPFGDLYLATLVVGAVFVLRDYAQREIGHKVLLATLAAGAITWYMTTPALALASITAFAISEMADWAVFSFEGQHHVVHAFELLGQGPLHLEFAVVVEHREQ